MRWKDVQWASGRAVVRSPKTEHHQGKASRTIPIFPELRPYLEEASELATDGAEYVIGGTYRQSSLTPSRWRNCNLRTQFERLVKRAGLEPWPRLFHALRASRETELAQTFPLHVVTAWLGNTPRIAMKYYLQVTDADFEKAAKGGAESGADAVQKSVQQPAATSRTDSQPSPESVLLPLPATPCWMVHYFKTERTGDGLPTLRNGVFIKAEELGNSVTFGPIKAGFLLSL